MTDFSTASEGAYFAPGDGFLYYAEGPFLSHAEPPEGKSVFYINDYELTDPRPWKEPAALHKIDRNALCSKNAGTTEPRTHSLPAYLSPPAWSAPDSSAFAEVFHEILENIQNGTLQKAVPVVTETSLLPPGEMPKYREFLLQAFSELSLPLLPYAYWDNTSGFVGASPETLFSIEDNILHTMALAGTARQEDASLFALDRKEISEHEYVVQSLIEKLSPYGKVTRSPRATIDLKNLIHFHSPLTLVVDTNVSYNEFIKRLHPTPALGPLPKTTETLHLQYAWRHQLHCPTSFGAPFGFLHEGKFACLVTIRGFFWNQDTLQLPSGCGIISESKLTHEWSELQLKRQSVRKNIHLP